jgi:hypothetical protein
MKVSNRYFAGEIETENGTKYAVACGYYMIVCDNPENIPAPQNADTLQKLYNTNVVPARANCVNKVPVNPDYKALTAYERELRKSKRKIPFNFGEGMPAVNPRFMLDVLAYDHGSEIWYKDGKHAVYIRAEGMEAIMMPVQKNHDIDDVATDLTPYATEAAKKPAPVNHYKKTEETPAETSPAPVLPWYLREDAAAETVSAADYTAPVEIEEETEPEQEMPETKPLNYTITRTAPNGKMCNYAAFATITRATANIMNYSYIQPNHEFTLYRNGTFYKRYKAGKELANDLYAQIAREMERARNDYQPPEPSNRDTIIAQTAAIMGDRIKIVKVGA